MSDKKDTETTLEKFRKKINTKAAAVMLSAATIAGGGVGIKKYNELKASQQKIENYQNYQIMADKFKSLFPNADRYIFDEEKAIFAAVYTIPEDLQKELAVEYDYTTKTRENIRDRLVRLEAASQHLERLSQLGFNTGINIKENKEYKILSEVMSEMPEPPHKAIRPLVAHGNAINKIDFHWMPEFMRLPEEVRRVEFIPSVETDRAPCVTRRNHYSNTKDLQEMLEEYSFDMKATVFAQNQLKEMRDGMKIIEKKLHEAGLDKYLAEKNENIKVTQRKINFSEILEDASHDWPHYNGHSR